MNSIQNAVSKDKANGKDRPLPVSEEILNLVRENGPIWNQMNGMGAAPVGIDLSELVLHLHPKHRGDLSKSGLTPATIQAHGVRSVPPRQIVKHLGFNDERITSLLCFPYPREGEFCRDKVFPCDLKDKDGHGLRYLQRKNTGCRLYIPSLASRFLDDANVPLRITEGEKKALKACQECIPTIGLGGLWNFLSDGQLLARFDDIALDGREIILTPDAEVWAKRKDLLLPVYRLGRLLEARGAHVCVEMLPDEKGQDKLDDFLVSAGDQAPTSLDTLPKTLLSDARFISIAKREAAKDPKEKVEPWPILADEALTGLAGDTVKTIMPYTESDPVALLVTLLAMFGNVVKAGAHFLVEYTKHYVRLFVALVGLTAKGRKGQSLSTLRYVFEQLDPDWSKDRVVYGGLSSGEGVIDAVRDERRNDAGEVLDKGEPDKRLLLIEEELVSALKVASREGNTLSAILRQAWDRGDLRPLTKNNKIRATGAHVSIVSHITNDELLKYLTGTEQSNGFGNRFLWLLVKRSNVISRPVPVPLEKLTPLIDRLKKAVDFARTTTAMDRDEEAEKRWEEVYPALSEGKRGMVGAITARGEVQVMRLACLYALLDCSRTIKAVHLNAALALWDYADESAQLIFSDRVGDPAAERLLEAIRSAPDGLTDLEINTEVFSRNKSASELARIKKLLVSLGLIHYETKKDTGGRDATVWKATH